MISFPNAKINLGLNILNKREDGFHEIESCFYPIPWCDALEVVQSKTFNFQSYGLAIPGDLNENLCVKAYELIKTDFKIDPIEIHLLKSIPMGAGLGGGSANGAFTLKMLNEFFELNIQATKLQEYALELGSDCPFFIANNPVIATGRGERLIPVKINLAGWYAAIKNPNIHISTRKAYRNVIPGKLNQSITEILSLPTEDWKGNLVNDFEKSIIEMEPGIGDLKSEMYKEGATYASMTGSGSTVFGLFKEVPNNSDWLVFSL